MIENTKLKRQWALVEFEASADHEDLASWLMMQCGSIGCEILPADQGCVLVHASFDERELSHDQLHKIKTILEEYGLSSSLNSLRHKSVEEEDWLAKWKEGFEPFAIGDKFLICPPWDLESLTPEQSADRHVLVLEPGMAFGTGLHATTRYCLRALESQPAPLAVVDVGTGSGILAIACAMLHSSASVTGVDTDPVAIDVAKKNLQLNKMEGKIQLLLGGTEILGNRKFDLILSNLTCEDIVSLLPDYEQMLAPGGSVICAGILQEKLPLLETAMADRAWRKRNLELEGMWAGLTLYR